MKQKFYMSSFTLLMAHTYCTGSWVWMEAGKKKLLLSLPKSNTGKPAQRQPLKVHMYD
jgi:hypothetical protein